MSGERLLNRELSWLEFNGRVLEEAQDESVPLLERVKFLAIFSANLDEFFMVRVAGLKRRIRAGDGEPDPDGLTPAEALAAIAARVHRLVEEQHRCFLEELQPRLAAEGIRILRPKEIDETQRAFLDEYFRLTLLPVVTPLAGGRIDLIVRGASRLRPGVPGLSETIGVLSLVDRYLDHARVFAFENAGTPEYWLASADWMPRNLDHRVEIAFPVLDPRLQAQVREILEVQLADTVKARLILPDGGSRRVPADGRPRLRSQERLYELAAPRRAPEP